MKYEKFEGSLGEFLEQHGTDTVRFYRSIPHGYTDLASYSLKQLVLFYNNGEIYTEKEEDWTDHLPVLCWVSDYENDESKWCLRRVECVTYDGYYETDNYDAWKYARPVTQAEIDKMIWKGGCYVS